MTGRILIWDLDEDGQEVCIELPINLWDAIPTCHSRTRGGDATCYCVDGPRAHEGGAR